MNQKQSEGFRSLSQQLAQDTALPPAGERPYLKHKSKLIKMEKPNLSHE